MKKKLLVIALFSIIALPSYSGWEVLIGPAIDIINTVGNNMANSKSNNNEPKEPDAAALEKNEKRYEKDLNNPKKRENALNELIAINIKQQDIETAKKYYYMIDSNSVYTPFLSIVGEYRAQKNLTGLEEFLKQELSSRTAPGYDSIQRDASFLLSQIYLGKNDFDSAVIYYEKATKFDIDPAEVYNVYSKLVTLASTENNTPKLADFLTREIDTKTNTNYSKVAKEASIKIVDVYLKAGNFQEAENYYEKAVKVANDNEKRHLSIAKKKIDIQKDIEKHLTAGKSGNAESYFDLANIYYEENDNETGDKYLKMAADNGHIPSMKYIALDYFDEEEYKLAEKYFKLAADKGDADAMGSLGLLYEFAGKDVQAEKYMKMAASKGDVNAMIDLALLYKAQGKAQSALNYIQMATKRGADYEDIGNRMLYPNNRIHEKIAFRSVNLD